MRYWKNCGADRAKAHSIKINGSVLFSFSSIVICCWLCHKKWNCSIEHLYAFPETDFEQNKKKKKRNNNTHKNLRPTIRKSTCVSFSFQFYSNHTIYITSSHDSYYFVFFFCISLSHSVFRPFLCGLDWFDVDVLRIVPLPWSVSSFWGLCLCCCTGVYAWWALQCANIHSLD